MSDARGPGTGRVEELRAAAAKLRPSSPAVGAHTVAVKLHPEVVAALADWLSTAAANADALTWPNDFIIRALAVARAIHRSDYERWGIISPDVVTTEIDQLRTENRAMRHELEVMYGGAFDRLPSRTPEPWLRIAALNAAVEMARGKAIIESSEYGSRAVRVMAQRFYSWLEGSDPEQSLEE